MQCDYFDAGACRSCTLMGTAYARQLGDKQRAAQAALAGMGVTWVAPFASPESGFRNKAKLVVAGSAGAVTLGILDERGRGIDLRECGIHDPRIAAALPVLADFVNELRLIPYDVPTRRGEVKHLLVTVSPAGELMVRLVLRSTHHEAALRSRLPLLLARLPAIRVVSLNIQPAHKAVIEGEREIVLTPADHLRMEVNGIPLYLLPHSFFQTNTQVAAGLYRQAAQWLDDAAPASVWDLYCGVGGFALHLARPGRLVAGIEIAPDAIASAQRSAAELHTGDGVRFVVGDAIEAAAVLGGEADAIVVNPPRRGLGPELVTWLDDCAAEMLLYSSCNPASLARDLAGLPSWQPGEARLFDMFPQTTHSEILVRLSPRVSP